MNKIMVNINKRLWGTEAGKDVYLFTLDNGSMQAGITNYGATITSIITPDRNGNKQNIVLGYDDLNGYINDDYYMGCTVGRVAGRIGGARFTIEGEIYQLTANDGATGNHLHGGFQGFNKKVFDVMTAEGDSNAAAITLQYRSLHMEEGYPGTLDVWVTFDLSTDNTLTITYEAEGDSDTHLNLTNHSYFNLSAGRGAAINHLLQINSDQYLESDDAFLPTGKVLPVAGTVYDFTKAKLISPALKALQGKCINEYYLLTKNEQGAQICLQSEQTGRGVLITTDMPGVLFYTGDYLGGGFAPNQGVCLETQYPPDAANCPEFASTLLRKGQRWSSSTLYKFETFGVNPT